MSVGRITSPPKLGVNQLSTLLRIFFGIFVNQLFLLQYKLSFYDPNVN